MGSYKLPCLEQRRYARLIYAKRGDNRLLIVESHSPIELPKRYRNAYGQLMEHAPFYQRDLRLPEHLETIDERGSFHTMIKKSGKIYPFTYDHHPFNTAIPAGQLIYWNDKRVWHYGTELKTADPSENGGRGVRDIVILSAKTPPANMPMGPVAEMFRDWE